MIRTVEATIDEKGTVHLQEAVTLTGSRRALVTILEEEPYPVRPPRQGWEEHFKQIAESGEDQLLDANSLPLTQGETEEWECPPTEAV